MSFVVTARKWRPQRFDEVVGQEHITATLKNAIKNNRIAHAYLFTGPRGVGKTTTARILAKTLNCLNPVDFEPCNECEMCNSIKTGQSLDFIEIDGASNRGIDEIRTLRDSVKYAPTKGKYKVYIIDEVHMLTKESFNAFLKTLEEPPAHTIFIFATTDVHKVPLTIISRCQRYDFRRIQLDTIKTLLKKIADNEKIEIDDKTLTIIAKKADGALRDAESFFDQVVSFCGNKIDFETVSRMLNLIDDDIYFKLSDAVLDKNFQAVFDVTGSIYANGYDFIDFMNGLLEHFRNIMTVVLSGKADHLETADIYKEKYISYSGRYSEGDILRILNFLNKIQQELRYSQNHRLKVEIALSHLIGLERSTTITDLLSKIGESEIIPASAQQEPVKKNFKLDIPAAEGYSAPVKEKNSAKINEKKSADKNMAAAPLAEWNAFVEAVSTEQALILGSYIKEVTLEEIEGNKITLSGSDPHFANLLVSRKDYLQKKSAEIFGKKYHFEFRLSENAAPVKPSAPDPQNEKDPIAKYIIDELGGEEIIT